MKVIVKSSWTNPDNGRILPIGTILNINPIFLNSAYVEEVKEEQTKEKKTKKVK